MLSGVAGASAEPSASPATLAHLGIVAEQQTQRP